MKKLVSILLATAMLLSMAACGGEPAASSAAASGSTAAPAASGDSSAAATPAPAGKGKIAYICGNLGDKSFSDSGWKGMQTLQSEGWEVSLIETGDASKADKYDDYILDAIDNGNQYITASSTYTENCLRIAVENPEVKFVLFDDKRDAATLPPNVTVIFYAQNEGSYLVGMMAAAMSKTKTVAVNVGMDNPVIADFVTGYIDGVKAYDPTVKVVKASVGSWTDPAKMKEICLTQARENKADVFYQVSGGSGDGLFEACGETKTWAIGVDSDQYAVYKDSENPEKADVILSSMLKEVGNSLVSIFKKIEAGENVWQQTVTLGLQDNSVGYVENDFFKANVSADIQKAMADAANKVRTGELKIKSYYDFASDAEYEAFVTAARS